MSVNEKNSAKSDAAAPLGNAGPLAPEQKKGGHLVNEQLNDITGGGGGYDCYDDYARESATSNDDSPHP